MTYDPEQYGARCHECYLRDKRDGVPVGPEMNNAPVTVVTESPREKDVELGRPLVDAAGMEFTQSLKSIGIPRNAVNMTHALACRPPENDMDKLLVHFGRANKKRLAAKEDPMPHPLDCCRPRLLHDIGQTKQIITLGKIGLKATTGIDASITEVRGGPIEGRFDVIGNFITGGEQRLDVKVLPTLHPAFVLRARRWTRAFRSDLSRAFRWFAGTMGWQEPTILRNPTPDELARFLARTDIPYIYDVETTFDDPLVAKLKCVGIATETDSVVVHFLRQEELARGRTVSPYTARDEANVRGILRDFFIDPLKLKAGHNCLYMGTPVILGDGTSAPIEQLVRAKYDGEVMALNASGQMVRAKVVDWFRKRAPGQAWIVVRREGEKKGARGLTLTPDHEVYTQRGRVRADELVAGMDYILSGEPRLTRDEYDAMLGSLLGDSTVATLSNNRQVPKDEAVTGVFRGSHTPGTLAEEKARWLNDLLILREEVSTGGYKPGQRVTTYRTPAMRQVADMARLIYDATGRPRLRKEVLDRLGPIGLAWLFADDGGKHIRPDRPNEVVLIATCGFPEQDILEAADWFTLRYGPTTITQAGSLRLGVDATRAFIQHIAPYLLPSVRYKLPKGAWPEFVGFPEPALRKPHAVLVESVSRFRPGTDTIAHRANAETRWCLQTTEGNFLTGFGFVKNCGYFDRMVIEQHFGVTPAPIMDTILLHRLVESELPHKLGYVGSIYTDVTAWKAAHTAEVAQKDEELGHYCAIDCVVTARVLPKLAEAVQLRQQAHIVAFDHQVQSICAGMHRVGMLVDRKARDEKAVELLALIKEHLAAVRASVGFDMNPNSTPQVRAQLFDKWGLSPVELTKIGDPSTNDDALRLIRTQNRDRQEVVTFIDALRRYRRVSKEMGTYIKRLVPYGQPVDGVQFHGEDEEEEAARGLIMFDGRIHPDYTAHGTTSGRLSSSNPNCFTGDTEILTETGWVRFDALPRGVRVAQYHDDRRIEWALPTAYIEEPFDGELVHVKNQHIDLLTTPDHRCLLRNRKTGELRVFKAEDYPEDWQQLHGGTFSQLEIDCTLDVLTVMLIVAAQADGSWVKETKNKRLTFKFSKKRKIDRLRKLIERLGARVVVRIDKDNDKEQTRIEIEGEAVDEVFAYIGQEKKFGAWLTSLPPVLAAVFCEEVFYWDGCFTRKNNYSSNDRDNASWVQAMFALAGYRATLRAYQGAKNVNWQVDVTRRDYSLTTNVEKTRVPYKGKVYCVSVPSSYILVRRNGKVMVTGQSQNFPKHLRNLIFAQPGHVLVGADADQLELRIIASIARIPRYLETFRNGGDPHAEGASMMFGKQFDDLVPKSDQWSKLRTLYKGIAYASFYGSGDETVHGIVTSAENKDGTLMYPDLTLAQVATLRRRWLKSIPQMNKWWDDCLETYQSQGYMIDPVLGRRRDFLDGENFNEIVNFGIQSAGAHIIHFATFDLIDVLPFEKWGPGTGLINQCHDALVFEVPCPHGKYDGKDAEFNWCPPGCKCEANRVARLIKEAMNREVAGLDDIKFAAKPTIGLRWGEV